MTKHFLTLEISKEKRLHNLGFDEIQTHDLHDKILSNLIKEYQRKKP
jgi:hypothetical protein